MRISAIVTGDFQMIVISQNGASEGV